MKNNEKTTARKLTLEEIEALPKASVIWLEMDMKDDNGICWHDVLPLLVCVPGKGGVLMGGDRDSFVDFDINDQLMNDPDNHFWSHEPSHDMLPGITREERDSIPGDEDFVFPKLVEAITSRKLTFAKFCTLSGMDFSKFMDALNGKREFVQWEMVAIRTTLKLTADQTTEIFFPVFAAKRSASCSEMLKMCAAIGMTADGYVDEHCCI